MKYVYNIKLSQRKILVEKKNIAVYNLEMLKLNCDIRHTKIYSTIRKKLAESNSQKFKMNHNLVLFVN